MTVGVPHATLSPKFEMVIASLFRYLFLAAQIREYVAAYRLLNALFTPFYLVLNKR